MSCRSTILLLKCRVASVPLMIIIRWIAYLTFTRKTTNIQLCDIQPDYIRSTDGSTRLFASYRNFIFHTSQSCNNPQTRLWHHQGRGVNEHGQSRFGCGTLYTALRRMLEDGWIERLEDENPNQESRERKLYMLSDLGRRIFELDTKRLQSMVHLTSARLNERL